MQSTPFDPNADWAPLPFNLQILGLALEMKTAGLKWRPHVGCFVWDHLQKIEVPSPFPNQVYFILNLNRFLNIFKDMGNIISELVWVPTWHQARLIVQDLGLPESGIRAIWSTGPVAPGDELAQLYRTIVSALNQK
jgi:hypothetical protein